TLGAGFHGARRLLDEAATMEAAVARGIPTAPFAFGAARSAASGRRAAIVGSGEIGRGEGRAPGLEGSRAKPSVPPGAGGNGRRAPDLGLDHADLNIGNVLVGPDPGGGAWVIDLGVSKIRVRLSPAARAANLVRLLRSAIKHRGPGAVGRREAAAFLGGYLS